MEASLFAIVLLFFPFTGKEISSKVDSISHFYNELYLSFTTSNVEFLEGGNQMVFQLLEDYPSASLMAYVKSRKEVRELILSILENPINDSIDISAVIKRVRYASSRKHTKQKIIASLDRALLKGVSP